MKNVPRYKLGQELILTRILGGPENVPRDRLRLTVQRRSAREGNHNRCMITKASLMQPFWEVTRRKRNVPLCRQPRGRSQKCSVDLRQLRGRPLLLPEVCGELVVELDEVMEVVSPTALKWPRRTAMRANEAL
eukprot:9382971-Pyramimonas_sp.AAC.1